MVFKNVSKTYTCIYTTEVLDSNDPVIQSNITKPSSKVYLKHLLAEMECCLLQMNLQVTFWKETENNETKS